MHARPQRSPAEPFGYCLNTSTIKGEGLDILAKAEIAAEAGFDALEPWIRELDAWIEAGGTMKDLGRKLAALGLTVESAIGFPSWLADDDEKRQAGLAEARRNMHMLAELGGRRLAAPPFGLDGMDRLDLVAAVARYRDLLAIGDATGVVPIVEAWGHSPLFSTLGQAIHVAAESGHPKACILLDVFHMYKAGSSPAGLKLLSGRAIGIFHVNDYPAEPPRELIKDSARVYPGDGVGPLGEVFRNLQAIGYDGHLSLELFNERYYAQDPRQVARTGLEKLRAAVRQALNP